MKRELNLDDEDGTSMVELVVGMGMGMVVLAGLSMMLIMATRGNARVDARTEASDNARVAMTRIMEELHSACVKPTEPPIQATSTSNTLVFLHGTYGGGVETLNEAATETKITYSPTAHTLTEQNETEAPRIVLSHVSQAVTNGQVAPIFRYENSTVPGGNPFTIPTNGTLGVENSRYTILVRVAFKAGPKSEPVADAGAASEIENSATLRLTPPTFSETEKAKPCQ
ncbi:MAG TPA: hypothetical protein VN522_04235 [Solirubrobacterales bacterium]|nr:hypothetical protein [Solirubrobacterales bacterium]